MSKIFRDFLAIILLTSLIACSGGGDGSQADASGDIEYKDDIPPQFSGLTLVTNNFPEYVKLSWSPAKDNVTPENKIVYIICMSEQEGECKTNFTEKYSVTGQTNYQIRGLIEGKKYFFVVRAKDEAGNMDSNSVEKNIIFEKEKDKTSPTFMGLSYATPSGSDQVRLLWNPATDNNTPPEKIVYSICVSENKGECTTNFKESLKTPPGATSYNVEGLTTGKTYYFVVRAVDEDGNMELNKEERVARPSKDNRFAKTYGDATYRGASAFVTIDDGFIICGGGRVGDMLDSDIFISRLDIYGNVKWIKSFGGLKSDSCSSIASDGTNSFYVAGTTQSFSQLGDKDLLLIKYSMDGEVILSKRIYSDKNDLNGQVSMLSDGRIIYTGYTEMDNKRYDSFIILFDKDLKPIKRVYLHSEADDYITRVKVYNDRIYLVGYTNPSSEVNYDSFLVILDKDLNILSQKIIGGSDYDNLTALDINDDGTLVLAGQTKSFGESEGDIFVLGMKSDSMEKTFAKVYINEKKKDSAGDLVIYNNSIILVGDMVPPIGGDNDGIYLKLNMDGNVILSRFYRGIRDDWLSKVSICKGDICVLGGTASMHNETSEVWFFKMQDDGTIGGECKVSYVNDLSLTVKDIEPLIVNGNFSMNNAEIAIDDVGLDSLEVGAYTDYQCISE